MTEISVIVPVYNAEKYLNTCIHSLLCQTVGEWMEVIFIDDGSTDHSAAILDSTGFHVVHTEHKGVSHARNIGLDHAKGRYIAFIDADDYIENDYFESLLQNLKGELIGGGFTAEYPHKSVPHVCKKKTELFGDDIPKAFLQEKILSPIAADKIFLREKIDDLRFDESLAMAEDRWFLFRYLQKVRHITVVPSGKYHYVMNDSSVCRSTFDDRKLGSLTVCQKITESIESSYPSLLPYAMSSEIDMKCRVYGEMSYFGVSEKYGNLFHALKKDIQTFSLFQQSRCSDFKHTMALLAAKISPKLYMFLKNDMKLQYI